MRPSGGNAIVPHPTRGSRVSTTEEFEAGEDFEEETEPDVDQVLDAREELGDEFAGGRVGGHRPPSGNGTTHIGCRGSELFPRYDFAALTR